MPTEPAPPPGYLLTWSTYGTWLHGDDAGSVDRRHNKFGTPFLEPSRGWVEHMRRKLTHEPVTLSIPMRDAVAGAIRAHCLKRGWTLAGLSVRTNHVHIVIVQPSIKPEPMVKQLKEWAPRYLRRANLVGSEQEVWSAHASTRYLYEHGSVERATEYVRDQDGKGLGRFRLENPNP